MQEAPEVAAALGKVGLCRCVMLKPPEKFKYPLVSS